MSKSLSLDGFPARREKGQKKKSTLSVSLFGNNPLGHDRSGDIKLLACKTFYSAYKSQSLFED